MVIVTMTLVMASPGVPYRKAKEPRKKETSGIVARVIRRTVRKQILKPWKL